MALGALTGLRQIAPETLAQAALVVPLLVLLGVAGERFAGLDAISEPVRAFLFPDEIIYAEDFRDQLVYGAVRAKLFTSEPSHVAKAFVLALLVWYVCSIAFWRIPVAYGLLAAAVLLVKSPGILMVLPAIWATDLCRMRNSRWLVLLLFGGVIAVAAAILASQALFPDRLSHIASGRDSSFIIRATLPLEILGRVWTDHPLFGLGFGAKESSIPCALAVGQEMKLDLNTPLGNNGLFIGMIQIGLVGSMLFAVALVCFWRFACGPYWPCATIALLGYLTLIGGINDPRFWGGFALITAACAAAARREMAEALQQRGRR